MLRRLRPLYQAARARTPHAFVNLDMEEYRDLDLTVEVFTALLAEPEFHDLEAGIVLQAYLPDSLAALERLIAFAQKRVLAGGANIKIRLVKGANLSMEQVEAELHGWAQAPYATKADVDANYLRLVERVLRPELAGVVRLGVASHNLYDVALAHLLAAAPRRQRRPGRRDAPGHGPRAGPGGARQRRHGHPLHARGGAGGLRRRRLLPHPPAGGERPAAELPPRPVRRRRRGAGRRRRRWAPWWTRSRGSGRRWRR